MKKIVVSLMLGGLVVFGSGCQSMAPFSSYNHNRVKDQVIREQIVTKGSQEQKVAMASGIRPSSVIKLIPSSDGRGVITAIDWMNPDNMSYFKTFAEAPISSTAALLGDTGLWTGLIYLGSKAIDGQNGKQETNISVGDGSGNTAVNVRSSGNSTDINTTPSGGGNTVINVDSENNSTTINNTPPPAE